MRPRSPKRWLPPKARRTREERFWSRLGGSRCVWILKSLWTDGTLAPPWAELSYKHGWITLPERILAWRKEPQPDPRGRISERLYRSAPLFGFIPKDTSWDEVGS